MTNEELAVLAAQGDKESQYKLYFAVAPLIYKLVSRYFKYCEHNRRGVRPEDLVQVGYFAYLEALKQYSPERELKFTSYLDFCVAGACWRELGISFPTGRKPVNREVETISLETPISREDEERTLGDTIADPEADTAEFAELNDMQMIIRREVDRLKPSHQFVIYGLFWEEKTLEQINEERGWGVARAHKIKIEVYHKLYCSEVLRRLAEAYAGIAPWRRKTERHFAKFEKYGEESIVTWNRNGINYLDKETVDDLFKDSELTPIGGGTIWD